MRTQFVTPSGNLKLSEGAIGSEEFSVCKGLFGSLGALFLAGGFVAAQAPSLPVGATPAETDRGSPVQPATPDPAGASPPTLIQAPPALDPGEEGVVPGGTPSFGMCLAPGGARGPSFFVGVDYLLWWTKGQFLPPLATIGSPADMPPGALGQPGTLEVIGNNTADGQVRSGARFTAGAWINESQTIGLEGDIFFLQPRSSRFLASSAGVGLLAVPFFAVGTITNPDGSTTDLSQESALPVATPGASIGNVVVSTANRFWGAEANGLVNVCRDCSFRVDLLAGFRYLELKDQLDIASLSVALPPNGPMTVTTADNFNTRNRFYGGQFGAVADFWYGRWLLDLRGKVALGGINRFVGIDGSTALTTANGTSVFPGGLFTQPTNIGARSSTAFGVVPEVNVRVGYQFTNFLRAYVGYSLIYIARNVVQPGDQIDRAINVNQIQALSPAPLAGDVRPLAMFTSTDFWAQGFQAGLEFNF